MHIALTTRCGTSNTCVPKSQSFKRRAVTLSVFSAIETREKNLDKIADLKTEANRLHVDALRLAKLWEREMGGAHQQRLNAVAAHERATAGLEQIQVRKRF